MNTIQLDSCEIGRASGGVLAKSKNPRVYGLTASPACTRHVVIDVGDDLRHRRGVVTIRAAERIEQVIAQNRSDEAPGLATLLYVIVYVCFVSFGIIWVYLSMLRWAAAAAP